MSCLFRVNKKCYSVKFFRRKCGPVCMVLCGRRREFARAMEDKKRLIEADEGETVLGIGAWRG